MTKSALKKIWLWVLLLSIIAIIPMVIYIYFNDLILNCNSHELQPIHDTIQNEATSDTTFDCEALIDSTTEDAYLETVAKSNITYTSIEKINKQNPEDSLNSYAQILMLGDSHLMGPFGEHLQRFIHESGFFDILSISIAGAGSATFVYPLRNNCCGFAIRESLHDEKIPSNRNIRYLEYNSGISGEIVGKKYNGRLSNVLLQIEPDIIIIALGSNYSNDHQGLINILKKHSQTAQIVWIGPMRRKQISMRIKAIQSAVEKNGIFFVRSDDVIGSDTLSMGHYYGPEAKRWAKTIYERVKPLLDCYTKNQQNAYQNKTDSLTHN